MVGTARGAVQPQKPPGINAVLCTGQGLTAHTLSLHGSRSSPRSISSERLQTTRKPVTKNALPTFSKQLPTEVRATDPGQAEEKLTRGWEAFCSPKRGGRRPEDKSTLIASTGAALRMTVWLRQKKGACLVQLRRRGRAVAAGTWRPLSRAQDTYPHRIPSRPRLQDAAHAQRQAALIKLSKT